ncbi:MAG: PEP-utilizing enzyme [Wenzhouxiangellaceae bacterium]|nr:PEP-utilizing enzyme [Wenzhouxiangellaceae bacterium]
MLQDPAPGARSRDTGSPRTQPAQPASPFGTKAEMLRYLQARLTRSRIEDQVCFRIGEWNSDQAAVVDHVRCTFGGLLLAVRSSVRSEDGFAATFAGAFTTVLDVDGADEAALADAISRVIRSFPDPDSRHQVLIQPMVWDVIAGGVVLTRTLSNLAPYFTIDYDDATHTTTTITSGTCREHKTLVIHHDAAREMPTLPSPLENLLPAIVEIESLLNCDSLNMEFAISRQGYVHILQVRPIARASKLDSVADEQVAGCIARMRRQFHDLRNSGSLASGRRGGYGVMPDWNPAEIIGTRPGALAMSLYRYLLLDDVWARQRAGYGYRDVRPQPLLVDFCGRPYIDIRASFHSFIPAGLDDDLSARLVDFYLTRLEDNPHLHDKVEFDVLPTCHALDFAQWRVRLRNHGGFAVSEINRLADGLLAVTRGAFLRNALDLANVARMEQRLQKICNQADEPLGRAFRLLEDGHLLGAPAFAHMARSAFVAISLLRSAVRCGIISQPAMDGFVGSVRTVSRQVAEDLAAVNAGALAPESFIAQYGHLRPGTYEIASRTYREISGEIFDSHAHPASQRTTALADRTAWSTERAAFGDALKAEGLSANLDEVERFMSEAIRGREYAKFALSRNLSLSLDALIEFGSRHGIGRETLSNIALDDFRYLHNGSVAPAKASIWLSRRARQGARLRRQAASLELPPLIFSERDFSFFTYPRNQANFVCGGRALAQCIVLESGAVPSAILASGKIVLLPQADPGFDWLFGQSIAGLITQYGGANSHMTIRAAEHGVPAAIGVGEFMYRRLSQARMLELDAGAKRIEVIA